jgi:hypothetical protein
MMPLPLVAVHLVVPLLVTCCAHQQKKNKDSFRVKQETN